MTHHFTSSTHSNIAYFVISEVSDCSKDERLIRHIVEILNIHRHKRTLLAFSISPSNETLNTS